MTKEMTTNTGKSVTPLDALRGTISQMQPQFQAALPPHIKPERFVRTVFTALQTNPTLVGAERNSLLGACMKAAHDGLLPDGREAAIVTFKGKNGVQAQLIPMVSGVMKKVRNSGDISTWSVNVVKENDEFLYVLGDEEKIVHKPVLKNRGNTVAVYSIVTMKDGEKSREIMSVDEVNSIRARSRSKDNGPWVTDFDEMAKKTVIRRHSKRLPMSTDLEDFIRQDDSLIDLNNDSETNAPTEPPVKRTRSSKLSDAIDAKAKPINAVAKDVKKETEPEQTVQTGDTPELPQVGEDEIIDRPAALEDEGPDLDDALAEEPL